MDGKKLHKMAQVFYRMARSPGKAAGLLLVEPKSGTIFLTRRSKKVDAPGTWSVVGGGINHGESALEAAKRETVEEAGSLPEILDILKSSLFKDGDFTYETFVCKVSPKTKHDWKPRLNPENDKFGWFKLDNLPDSLHPGLKYTLKELKGKNGQ